MMVVFRFLTPFALLLFAFLTAGCTVEQRLSYSVLALQVPRHDPEHPSNFMSGTAVCVKTAAGEYAVYTVHHVALAGNDIREITFRRFNDITVNDGGNWEDLNPYVSSVTDIPDEDLTIIHLRTPIKGVEYVQIAEQVNVSKKIVAFGFGPHSDETDHSGRILRGTLDDVSINGEVLAATLGSRFGDSGGPIFDLSNEKLVGLMHSCLVYAGSLKSPFQLDLVPSTKEWKVDRAGLRLSSDTFAVALSPRCVGLPRSGARERYARFVAAHYNDPGIYDYDSAMKPETAIAAYTRLIESADTPPEIVADALCSRGSVFHDVNKPAEEITDFTRVLESKDTPPSLIPYAFNGRAAAHWQVNEVDMALADYTRLD